MNFIIKVLGKLKNNLYICIMSLTKRYIEAEMEKGNDVLNPNNQHLDDEYQRAEWCYYSGMPSPEAYKTENVDEDKFDESVFGEADDVDYNHELWKVNQRKKEDDIESESEY